MPDAESTFSIKLEQKGGVTIAHCNGRIVAGETNRLSTEVKPLFEQYQHVVLDLTGVTRMDSMGLGAIVGLTMSAKRAGCKLELVNLGKQIRQLFAISNLLTMFEDAGDNTFRIP